MRTIEIVLPGIGEPETLQARTRELSAPGPGQTVVRVEATGVSFAEQQMRRGKYYDQPPFPFVPGYDLVGVDEATGRRVAALTKTGGWADRVVLDKADLVPVPDDVTAADAETVVVNGVTAWRMLFRTAKVEAGQTIVVLGANGGVGSTLVQLARHAGIEVIGTASTQHHDALRALGVTPVDYRTEDVPARVRALAPRGVAAVFDQVGGRGLTDSWRMLAKGGTLVSYGSASTKDDTGNSRLPVLKLVLKLLWWNVAPNGKSASFFNLWAGKARNPRRYRAELHEDLGHVFELLAEGSIVAQVARTFPLAGAAAALRYAESGGVAGKVVILP
jgi:NADPH:quinone reductase-like Zn-dependent oxidoreductase